MKLNKNDVVLFSGDSITDGNRGKSMDCNHIMGHGYHYIIAGRLALDNAENMPKFINKGYSGENAIDLHTVSPEQIIGGIMGAMKLSDVPEKYHASMAAAMQQFQLGLLQYFAVLEQIKLDEGFSNDQ